MVLLSNCASQHMTLYRFHQIQVNLISYRFLIDNWVANWRIIQSWCDRHARQLYDSVVGNSGDIFFATCFRQFMIFCAKFYFSAQMATMVISNANPVYEVTQMYVGSGDFWLYNIHNILILETEQIMLGLIQTTCQLKYRSWSYSIIALMAKKC